MEEARGIQETQSPLLNYGLLKYSEGGATKLSSIVYLLKSTNLDSWATSKECKSEVLSEQFLLLEIKAISHAKMN